jgi:hypothetical protein
VQAPALQVTDTDPRTQWPKNLDDDPVLIGKLIKDNKNSPVSILLYQAGTRIPIGSALAFQQAIADPADPNQRTAPPIEAGLDFSDGALRIRARVTDPLSLDTTQLVIQQATGNLGISTTSPDAKLTIQQGDASQKALSVRKDDAGSVGIDFFLDRITAAGTDQSLTIAAKGTGSLLLNPEGGRLGIHTGALNISDTSKVIAAIAAEKVPDANWNIPGASVLKALQTEKDAPKPRLVITGDVLIIGRLLVTNITELGGKVSYRAGS